jgi:hypothetical protein
MDKEYLYLLFKLTTIVLIIIAAVFLFVLSIIIRDYRIIVEHPFIFTIELLFMMILPAIPLLFFKVSRGLSLKDAIIWATSLAGKFGIFHVLFQFSGVYTYLFGG